MEFQKILIGIDDSKYAENAARYGFELAHKFNARVGLVHIVEPVINTPANDTSMMGNLIPGLSTSIEEPEIINVREQYSKKMLDDAEARYGKGLEITHFNEFGSTSETIIECATQFGADLIVIGTHSRSGFDRFLMGSVAESVVRHSPVAVLVIPMKDDE